MDERSPLTWYPVDALLLFTATINIMLEETKQQLHYLKYLKTGIIRIEKRLNTRIIKFYHMQLNKIMHYDEQLSRWTRDAAQNSNVSLLDEILELKKTVGIIKHLSQTIIKFAKEGQTDEKDSLLFNC